MILRLDKKASQRKVPNSRYSETPANGKLLGGRAAAIIGASFEIAVCVGALVYLVAGRSSAGLICAVLAGGEAFARAIRLLDSIIG